MGALGLISFIFALVVVPVVAARQRVPRNGLRLMMSGLFVASIVYTAFAAYVYSTYYRPEAF
jgi:hypothetical protein